MAPPAGKGFLPPADGPYFGDVAKAMAAVVMKGKAKGGKGGTFSSEGPFTGDVAPKGDQGWKGGWKGGSGKAGKAGGGWSGSGWKGGWDSWAEGGASEGKGKGGWGKSGRKSSWEASWGEVEVGAEADEWTALPQDEQPPGLDGRGGRGRGAASEGRSAGGRGGRDRKWQPVEPEPGAGKARERDAGAGGGKEELLALIDSVLQEPGSVLQRSDFDSRVRQFLSGLRSSGGAEKVQDALEMIRSYTSQKSRASVGNWPAYLLTLLKKFEPDLGQKGRGRGKGAAARQPAAAPFEPTPRPAAPATAAPAAPAPAAPAPAAAPAAPAGTEEAPAAEEPEEAAGAVLELPAGWEDGRRPLSDEISGVLTSLGGGRPLLCPFTGELLDCQATLVSHVASSIEAAAAAGAQRPEGLARHVAGLARAREFADCPRAAAAASLAGLREIAALPEDASALDAAAAAAAAARARPSARAVSGIIMQELGLELSAEMLRGPWLAQAAPPA